MVGLSGEETWYPISDCGGVSTATADGSLSVTRDGSALDVAVCSSSARDWTLLVSESGRELVRRAIEVRPDASFRSRDELQLGNPEADVIVRIVDGTGHTVLESELTAGRR